MLVAHWGLQGCLREGVGRPTNIFSKSKVPTGKARTRELARLGLPESQSLEGALML